MPQHRGEFADEGSAPLELRVFFASFAVILFCDLFFLLFYFSLSLSLLLFDSDASDPGWAKHEKHFFVLSNAGKPIYTRYGNEDKLSTIMGVIQALISFIQDDNNSLR